jgi:hypothetical protein
MDIRPSFQAHSGTPIGAIFSAAFDGGYALSAAEIRPLFAERDGAIERAREAVQGDSEAGLLNTVRGVRLDRARTVPFLSADSAAPSNVSGTSVPSAFSVQTAFSSISSTSWRVFLSAYCSATTHATSLVR